jgi:hypothetical protein
MFSVHCPHCRKETRVPNDRAGSRIRCSGCNAELQTPDPESDESGGDPAYTVKTDKEGHDAAGLIQDYVEDLTRKAAKQRKQKPYRRDHFPVSFMVGLLLYACALGIFLFVLLGQGGMMNTLINGILLPMIFIIVGSICIFVGGKRG